MTDLTPEESAAIQVAHDLVDMGAPIFTAFPDSLKGGFMLPNGWPQTKPNHRAVDLWRPGRGLAMVTGVVFDVLDVDPRNGGLDGWAELHDARAVPLIYGTARTPSEGWHYLINRTRLAKAPSSKVAPGVDLQAGEDGGNGRGFVWIAPTVRESKYGARKGERVAYWWADTPAEKPYDPDTDPGLANLQDRVQSSRRPRRLSAPVAITQEALDDGGVDDLAAFGDLVDDWTEDEAWRVIKTQIQAVRAAQEGEINSTLGGAARVLGRFVAGGFLGEDTAVEMLLRALETGGVHSDSWNVANGKDWTARTVIGAGLANGADEPWTVDTSTPAPPAPQAPSTGAATADATTGGASGRAVAAPATVVAPALEVTSAADMAYWLQSALGSGSLGGFFRQRGQVVHTALMGEEGYVEPAAKDDENGPAQIRAVSAPGLAAKIQYAFRCYKMADVKGEDGKKTGEQRQVAALFPVEAARRAVDAPEAMSMLRPLAGITHTPMVRADGSVLDTPGYDPASRYLFLPGPGVNVARVPAEPTGEDVARAVGLLAEMTAGFPWDSEDDRANYYAMLLTPMLRLVTPPAYKMFGITAHQPGSGKTLLADVARLLHGGVLRSELPDKEYEIKQMATAVLVGTEAPIVHVDNVSGVLRSAFLAGLLTASTELQERELGNNSAMLAFTNDRTWVFTGNNMSLGGDLVRRTVLIQIDPNMASPESREFAIADLKGWVDAHRNELLWALLVMIRHWVASGRPLEARKQSDSYTLWQRTVGGILAACGVPGRFDAASGQKAAGGGDDDGLVDVLERIWSMRGDKPWVVADVLDGTTSTDLADLVGESREWLPGPVLDKLARSEAAGRKTFGYWLRNRLGRWVSSGDGHSYVIRAGSRSGGRGQEWRVERSG